MMEGMQYPEARRYRRLSVLVPVYNERTTVGEVLRRVRQAQIPMEMEVIVVDDGSTDGTDAVLKAISDSTIRVIRHATNMGKGAALKTAVASASGDLLLVQDADLEYDPGDWPALLAPVLSGKAEVVYGSRFTGPRRNMFPSHWIGNRFLTLVTNMLYRSTLSDMETCYKLFTRDAFDGIEIQSRGFDVEPELTAKILRKGIRIYEVPVSYAGREVSEGKKIRWQDGFKALVALVKYRVTSL
ncbi:MAG: glycosyltransferase family 2 protein [Acidimicrobiales bacterium]